MREEQYQGFSMYQDMHRPAFSVSPSPILQPQYVKPIPMPQISTNVTPMLRPQELTPKKL
jgi:hypothetical protein